MSANAPFDFSLRTLFDSGKSSFDVAFCLNGSSSSFSGDSASTTVDNDFTAPAFKAHSCVLELHGKVFVDVLRDARTRDASSSSTGKLTIRLVDVLTFVVTEDVLDVFVKYLYYGSVEFNDAGSDLCGGGGGKGGGVSPGGGGAKRPPDYASNALLFKRLYLLARHFRLKHLEGICFGFFDSILAPDKNALDVLDFGRCYGIHDLVSTVVDVVETSKSFFGDPEILALIRKDTIEYICSATTRLPVPEHIVVEWLLIWKQAHNNAENFDRLSHESFLHFEQFPYDFLAKILNSGLLSDHEMMKVYKDKAAAVALKNNNNNNDDDDDVIDGGSPSPYPRSKPVTNCAVVRYNGVPYEVGFGPTEFPAKLKRRFMRLIAKTKVDDDVELKQILTLASPATESSTQCSSMKSLRGDSTLAENGVADGSILIAVPKPKMVIKVVALRPKRRTPVRAKMKKKTVGSRNKRPSKRRRAREKESSGGALGKNVARSATPPLVRVNRVADESNRRSFQGNGGHRSDNDQRNDRGKGNVWQGNEHERRSLPGQGNARSDGDDVDAASSQGQRRDGDLRRRRSGSFDVKIEDLPDSPPHCGATASECSSVEAGVAFFADSAAFIDAGCVAEAPSAQDPTSDHNVKQSARERVFWWKSNSKGPKLSAAESCIPAIKSSRPSRNSLFPTFSDTALRGSSGPSGILISPIVNDAAPRTLSRPSGKLVSSVATDTAFRSLSIPSGNLVSSSASDAALLDSPGFREGYASTRSSTSTQVVAPPSRADSVSSPARPNLDDSGLSLDRSRSYASEAEIVEPEADAETQNLAPLPTKKLRQRSSRKRASQEKTPSAASQSKSQARPKKPKGSRSRESLVRGVENPGAPSNDDGEVVVLESSNRQPAAPESSFKQAFGVIPNRFELGMKLEVPDPKAVVNTICIATVVDRIGPRLRLRLDGTDDRNDIWRLVNDATLRSVGNCERRGQHLQPPVSFRKNISVWRKFLFETLKDAKLAPENCFIPEPQDAATPMTVGQKLEAVDRKNECLICPATVAEVTTKELLIHFDGWNPDSYDYWCDRNSRDLFPVGWCQRNEHPLQPVGKELQ